MKPVLMNSRVLDVDESGFPQLRSEQVKYSVRKKNQQTGKG
jgi:hypothetical protein